VDGTIPGLRRQLTTVGPDDHAIQRRVNPAVIDVNHAPAGWIIDATYSWLLGYGALRNASRTDHHRL
jgi:hypothetical protein